MPWKTKLAVGLAVSEQSINRLLEQKKQIERQIEFLHEQIKDCRFYEMSNYDELIEEQQEHINMMIYLSKKISRFKELQNSTLVFATI